MESIYSIQSEKEIPDNRLFSQAKGGLFALEVFLLKKHHVQVPWQPFWFIQRKKTKSIN